MAAISHRHRVVYFPIPKIATSSLKQLIYHLDAGRPYDRRVRRELGVPVHKMYPHQLKERWYPYFPAYTSIVVVRDPITRLLSAYAERILETDALTKQRDLPARLTRKRLSAKPSLDEFVENIEAYRDLSGAVRNHTMPQSDHVGTFGTKITHRLPIERIGEVPDIIRQATGVKVSLPHARASGLKPKPSNLSPRHFDKLVKLYEADYEMLGEFYSPDRLR
jgi:hypothetical protein